MPSYFTFVEFVRGSQREVVLSSEVKDFEPSHANDFKKGELYSIQWQAVDGSFDGHYQGRIICQAVTLEELKSKAALVGIKRMPKSFFALQNIHQNPKKTSPSSSSQMAVKRTSKSNHSLRAKVLRMDNILSSVSQKTRNKNDHIESVNDKLESEGEGSCDSPPSISPACDKVCAESDFHDNADGSNGEQQSRPKKDESNVDVSIALDSTDTEEEISDSGEEDSTSKLLDTIGDLKGSLKAAKQENLSLKKTSEDFEEKIRLLNMAVKVSEEKRHSDRKELDNVNLKLKKLETENCKLKEVISTALDVLGADTACLNSTLSSPSNRSPGFNSQMKSPTADSFPGRRLSYSPSSSSKSPSTAISPSLSPAEGYSASKKPTTSSKKSSSGGRKTKKSTPEMPRISENVRKDLLGEDPLPVDTDGKVTIGGGIRIAKKKWDDGIKVQSKSTLFVKKLALATYGHEGLKCRTAAVQGKVPGKKVATPEKVNAIVACLRGKLLSEDPKMPDVDFFAERARDILSEKCQDEARKDNPSRKKKDEKKKAISTTADTAEELCAPESE